jgi:hypothetical protein
MKRTTGKLLAVAFVLAGIMIAPIILSQYYQAFRDFLIAYSSLFATIVLVGLTAWYAITTSETLTETRKDRLRPAVRHIVDVVLEGVRWSLYQESERLEHREYDYHKADHYRFFNPIPERLETSPRCEDETERYLLKKLLEERVKTGRVIPLLALEHNQFVGMLGDSNDALFKALSTPEFVASFQMVSLHNPPTDPGWLPFERQSDFLAAVLVNWPDETGIAPNSDEFLLYYANKNASKGFLARTEVQEKIRNRDEIASRLRNVAERLRQEIARVQEKLFDEYLF